MFNKFLEKLFFGIICGLTTGLAIVAALGLVVLIRDLWRYLHV